MKKRLWAIAAVLASLSAAVLVGCGDPHTHDYKWESNDTAHWQECACGEKTAETAHVDEKNNATGAAGKDELCDDCGKNLHVHAYEWKSDATKHWQECVCGDKKSEAAHADAKNNETQADGADDKCDACAREYYAVIFDMKGHGEAVQNQKAVKGGYATAPEKPADDDTYKFKGWYKDDACTTAFDFVAEAINAATTVYAKWEEDTTPGASKKYAHELTKDVQSLQNISKNTPVYFVYTAEEAGRYTVSLGTGVNSLKCTFTTDVTEGTYDADNYSVNFDLTAEQRVYITLMCAEDLDADAQAGVIIEDCTGGDPLPQEYFLDGCYFDGSNEYILDRAAGTMTYNETPYLVRYIGGSVNKLCFTRTVSGDGIGSSTTEYTVVYNDGKYKMWENNNTDNAKTLTYFAAQAPIAVAKFSGKYVPADKAGDEITEIVIYESGNGYLMQGGHKYSYYADEIAGSVYNQTYNRLCFRGLYYMTVNLDGDGNAESISLSGGYINGALVYTRAGDSGVELPRYLDVPNGDYVGNMFTLTISAYGGNLVTNDAWITITDYDPENGIYTITYYDYWEDADYSYNLKVVDEVTLKFYDTEDNTLVDTLVRFVPVFNTLPVGAEVVNTEDVEKDMYWYKAAQAGWYKVEWTDESLYVYGGLDESDPTNTYSGIELTSGDAVYLEQGGILGLYFGWYDELPSSVTITVSATTAPAGRTESNPVVLENDTATINNMDNQSLYYFSYTAPAAGSYLIKVSYVDEWGDTYFNLHYKMKGMDYGFTPDPTGGWDDIWYNGMSVDYPYAKITLAANETLLIIADRKGSYSAMASSVTVTVLEDYAAKATGINVANAPTGTLTAGLHKADLSVVESAVGIKLTSEKDMTVTVLGNVLQGKEIMLKSAQVAAGFKLECEGTVNYAVVSVTVYAGTLSMSEEWGTDSYRVTLSIADDYSMVIYNFIDFGYVYEADLVSSGNNRYTFSYLFQDWDDRSVTITINDNGTVTVVDGENGNATLKVPTDAVTYAGNVLKFIFEKDLADMEVGESIMGTYIDGESEITIKITKTGDNTFRYTDKIDATDTELTSGTIKLGDGCILVTDTYYKENGEMTLTKQP